MTDPRRDNMAWVEAIIRKKMADKSYGQVTVILEAGRIVHVKTEESHRPPAPEAEALARVLPRG